MVWMLMIDTLPDIHGLAPAMHGMRNPMNSWDRGDTNVKNRFDEVGPKDLELAKKLALGGPVHAKYRRMIMVWVDITAPLYWWKEFDTYKVGTVANSCSTMHKIQDKEFTLDDFSCEHLIFEKSVPDEDYWYEADTDGEWEALNDEYCGVVDSDFIGYNSFPGESLKYTIAFLNRARDLYLKTKNKKYWWQMIQLLPSSYNQKRTVCLNYEVLSHIYTDRRNHKLDEWHTFCDWIETLPHAEEMIFPKNESNDTREKVSGLLEKLYSNRGTNLDMTGVIADQYYCEEIWKALYGDDAEVPAWMRLWKGEAE
jgi:hypothetical protein